MFVSLKRQAANLPITYSRSVPSLLFVYVLDCSLMSQDGSSRSVTCQASPNIALIKYWGKRNEELILPDNDSFSITLDHQDIHSHTTVTTSPSMKCDSFVSAGVQQSNLSSRMQKVCQELRRVSKNSEEKFVEIRSAGTMFIDQVSVIDRC